MKFYFCEACGKRITENEIHEGDARDKKLRGVYCKGCSIGVTTLDTVPLSDTEAQKIVAASPERVKQPTSRRRRDTSGRQQVRKRDSGRAKERRPSDSPIAPAKSNNTLLIAGGAGGAVLLVVLGMFLIGSGDKSPQKKKTRKKKTTKVATKTVEEKDTTPPKPDDTVTPPSDDDLVEAQMKAQRVSFRDLESRLARIPDQQKQQKIEAVRQFLKESQDALDKARANRLLADLQKPPQSKKAGTPEGKAKELSPEAKRLIEEVRNGIEERKKNAKELAAWSNALDLLRTDRWDQAIKALQASEVDEARRSEIENDIKDIQALKDMRRAAFAAIQKKQGRSVSLWRGASQLKGVVAKGSDVPMLTLSTPKAERLTWGPADLDPRDVLTWSADGSGKKLVPVRKGLHAWILGKEQEARDAWKAEGKSASRCARYLHLSDAMSVRKAGGSGKDALKEAEEAVLKQEWKKAEALYTSIKDALPKAAARQRGEVWKRLAALSAIMYSPMPGAHICFRAEGASPDDDPVHGFVARKGEVTWGAKVPNGDATLEGTRFLLRTYLAVPKTGTWKLKVAAKGDITCSVDDVGVLQGRGGEVTVALAEGRHYLEIKGVHETGSGSLGIGWSLPDGPNEDVVSEKHLFVDPRWTDMPKTIVPNMKQLRSGVMTTYYRGTDFHPGKIGCILVHDRIGGNWGNGNPLKFVPTDKFCIRYDGFLRVDEADVYTFVTETDDGVALTVGGKKLIECISTNAHKKTAKVFLTPGYYTFRLDYTEYFAAALCHAKWRRSGGKPAVPLEQALYFEIPKPPEALPPIVTTGTTDPSRLKRGWHGTYINALEFVDDRIVSRHASQTTRYTWGRTPLHYTRHDRVCVRWVGKLKVDQAGSYIFNAGFNDGLRYWIGDRLVLDAWGNEGGKSVTSKPIELNQGYHDITLDFYELVDCCWLTLNWELPGKFGRQQIPGHVMFHDPAQIKPFGRKSKKAPENGDGPVAGDIKRPGGTKGVAKSFDNDLRNLIATAKQWGKKDAPNQTPTPDASARGKTFARVAKALNGLQAAVGEALLALKDGKPHTLTVMARRKQMKGVIRKVEGDRINITVKGKINNQTIEYGKTLTFGELTPETRIRFLSGFHPYDRDHWVALALWHAAYGDLDRARETLSAAAGHPLAKDAARALGQREKAVEPEPKTKAPPETTSRPADPAKEKEAKEYWKQKLAKFVSRTKVPRSRHKFIREYIKGFETKFGVTEFAGSVAKDLKTVKELVGDTQAEPKKPKTSEPVPKRMDPPKLDRRVKFKSLDLGNGVKLEMAWIPPGQYVRGSPPNEKGRDDAGDPSKPDRACDETPHTVYITKPFYIGRLEITQAQYKQVMGDEVAKDVATNKPELPASKLSWNNADAFCKKLSQKLGGHFRLPTEAEWEYACRAGTRTRFYSGDSEEDLKRVGWFKDNSNRKPQPVGRKEPNAFGLYDMHGNVTEWCVDGYRKYDARPQRDPRIPSGGEAVYRGGSYMHPPSRCRSAYRFHWFIGSKMPPCGMRVVLQLGR